MGSGAGSKCTHATAGKTTTAAGSARTKSSPGSTHDVTFLHFPGSQQGSACLESSTQARHGAAVKTVATANSTIALMIPRINLPPSYTDARDHPNLTC